MKIAFRIWDGQADNWLDSRVWTNSNSFFDFDKQDKQGKLSWFRNEGRFTLEQFTGLFDNIGQDIYEGDILHFVLVDDSYPEDSKDLKLVCERDEADGFWSFNSQSEDFYWYEIKRFCKVIGNIHQHPKLLK